MTFAVVYSAGRTGSHMICDNLVTTSLIKTEYPFIGDKPSIIHCHNPLYRPPLKTICIISKRRNIFDALISKIIASLTNKYYFYSNNHVTITPIVITVDELYSLYVRYISFYKLIKLNNSKIFEIYYEDLISNPYCLFSNFGVHKETKVNTSVKSPYHYKDIISNHIELMEAYQNFSEDNVTDEAVESIRKLYIDYAREHGNILS